MTDPRRRRIRRTAGWICLITAGLYLLVAFGVLTVESTAQPVLDLFGAAGMAYLLGAAAAFECDARWIWTLGAGVQIVSLFGYFYLAADREPTFEAVGLAIAAAQVLILVAMVNLAWTHPSGEPIEEMEAMVAAEEEEFGEIVEAETPYR